jgi:NitT/TauT family transport system permease protein
MPARRFTQVSPVDLALTAVLVALAIVAAFASSVLQPYDAPEVDPRAVLLPLYLFRSFARLLVAYTVAVLLALAVGYLAARSRLARRLILPTLDVLQSVPILGFFPAAVALFLGLFGDSALGVEAAAVFLIFTSMFWNLAFGVYEGLITIPEQLQMAANQFGLKGALRWSRLLLPAVLPRLLYNSILSWSNGWYFLIASEIIAVGKARYTLPGLGSYLGQAITQGRHQQTALALGALVAVTVGMHVLVWSPLETWAERFHIDETGGRPRTPRMVRWLGRSRIARLMLTRVIVPAGHQLLAAAGRVMAAAVRVGPGGAAALGALVLAAIVYGTWRELALLAARPLSAEARAIPVDLALSFLRVGIGVGAAVLLAVPIAYASFRRPRLRLVLLSFLEVLGAVPAVAFFPIIAILMVALHVGLNVGATLLVLTGTFFYVAFNVLSGAASIPTDMSEAASSLGLTGAGYLRRVFVPAILPSLVTGCVTAWGGGWNAIIFAEYVVTGGKTYAVRGIGATLDRATYVTGDMQVVTLSLLTMVALVVFVNRVFWDPLYQHVSQRYKLEA